MSPDDRSDLRDGFIVDVSTDKEVPLNFGSHPDLDWFYQRWFRFGGGLLSPSALVCVLKSSHISCIVVIIFVLYTEYTVTVLQIRVNVNQAQAC